MLVSLTLFERAGKERYVNAYRSRNNLGTMDIELGDDYGGAVCRQQHERHCTTADDALRPTTPHGENVSEQQTENRQFGWHSTARGEDDL